MKHPDLIGDLELQHYLLQHIQHRYRVQLSDFVPDFGEYIQLNLSQSSMMYWRRRIVAILVEMRHKGWIKIFRLDEFDEVTERFRPEFESDFLFEITEDGYQALKDNEVAPFRGKRREKQKGQDNWVVQTPIPQLIRSYNYPKPRGTEIGKEKRHREIIAKAIATRRGQQEFREKLLQIYEKCLVTGCDAQDVLEAAHIRPYCKEGTFEVSNGLLLRADIHTLFDLGSIAIDTKKMTVLIAPELRHTTYGKLEGRHLHFPKGTARKPNRDALDEHRREAGL
jgi:hypothetical protein